MIRTFTCLYSYSSAQAHALFMVPRTKMHRCHKDGLWQNNEKSYGDFRH